MSVTFGNNLIDVSTGEDINYAPSLLFCCIFFSCCTASMADVVIREMQGENRIEHELVVNVLVL